MPAPHIPHEKPATLDRRGGLNLDWTSTTTLPQRKDSSRDLVHDRLARRKTR